jgi:hypothetical protein
MPGFRWNRRETNVAQAGYFTVLRSTGWFSALSRLPGGYRYLVKGPATPTVLVKPEGAGTPASEDHDAGPATAPAFETLAPQASGLGLLRLALIALVAAGITALFFLLLHLDSPGG